MTANNQDIQVQHKELPKGVEMTRDLPVYSPQTDIYEKEDSILVVCDMPEVDESQVDVSLENNVLTLTGCQDAKDPDKHEVLYRDYRPGAFRRSFTLSADINHAGIKAKLNNGVLQVTLPKAEKAQPRKIKVEIG